MSEQNKTELWRGVDIAACSIAQRIDYAFIHNQEPDILVVQEQYNRLGELLAQLGLGAKIVDFWMSDVHSEEHTPVRLRFGNDGIAIHPKGMGVFDGDYGPILVEQVDNVIRLIYWPDINDQEPVIVDMSGALESARTPDE